MKKKILSILLICIMVIGLTGCGNKNDNKESSNNKSNGSKEVELYPVKVEEMEDYRGRYGYVNNKGQWVIEPQYISAGGFDPETGLAMVRMPKGDYAVGFINKKGEMVLDGFGSYSTHSFKNGYAVIDTDVHHDTYSTKKLIDKYGKEIIEAGKYEKMTDVSSDGILAVSEYTTSDVKVIKLDGTVLFELPYSGIMSNYQNLSAFNKNGYAYCDSEIIDKDGNKIKAEKGKIQSLNDNNYGFIEYDYKSAIFTIKDGKIELITDFIYKYPKSFNNENISLVHEENEEMYYFVDVNGKKINDKTYKSAEMLLDGKWVVKLEDGSNQVLNADGSILVDTFKVK